MKHSVKWLSVFAGILYTGLAIYLLANPGANLVGLSWLIAFGILTGGISEIITYFALPKSLRDGWTLASGILTFVVGMFLLSGAFITLPLLIPTIIGIWLTIYGIVRVIRYFKVRTINQSVANIMLGTGVLAVIFGLLIFFNPIAASITVSYMIAIAFLYNGIVMVIDAFKGTNE